MVMLLNEIDNKDLTKYQNNKRFVSQNKIDGDRFKVVINRKRGQLTITLINRHENDYTIQFPEIVAGFGIKEKYLESEIILDGEVAFFDPITKIYDHSKIIGRQHTQNKKQILRKRVMYPCKFYCFDVIKFNGFDMVGNADFPYEKRLEIIKRIIRNNNVTELVEVRKDLVEHYKEEEKAGREGIVIRDLKGIYTNDRSNSVLKCKCWKYSNVSFDDFEQNNDGSITLTNGKDRVLCPSRKDVELIKADIIQNGHTTQLVRHLQIRTKNNSLREPSWKHKSFIEVENV